MIGLFGDERLIYENERPVFDVMFGVEPPVCEFDEFIFYRLFD